MLDFLEYAMLVVSLKLSTTGSVCTALLRSTSVFSFDGFVFFVILKATQKAKANDSTTKIISPSEKFHKISN